MLTRVTEKNLASRSRAVQSEYRKRQLIDSTINCIDELGLSQTTMARIAKHAGVSQGIVVFHFQTKEVLFAQTLRRLSHDYSACWKNAYDQADPNPVSRLCALVKAVFSLAICNSKLISVWYAFWGDSRSRLLYMSLCGQHDIAYTSRLLSQCQALELTGTTKLNAQTAALSIEGMIAGLWQNFLIGGPGIKRREAVNAVFKFLQLIYPDYQAEIERFSER
ncbi:MAG: TetR/AcrR family bet gene transcriptional repressor [Gammaproteobacteria bacterium]